MVRHAGIAVFLKDTELTYWQVFHLKSYARRTQKEEDKSQEEKCSVSARP